jgi:CRISPR/Cas system-associated endoribonuclease Cas2
MNKQYLLIFFPLLFCVKAFPQSNLEEQSKIDELLDQRASLYKDYSNLKEQKSSFWGKQSKEDLRKIITTLKGIINKDDEIVQEILNQHAEEKVKIKKQSVIESSDLTLRERNLTDRVHDLNNQLGGSLSQLKVKTKENEMLKAKLENEKSENNLLEKFIAVLFLGCAGLAFYIFRLNKKLRNA